MKSLNELHFNCAARQELRGLLSNMVSRRPDGTTMKVIQTMQALLDDGDRLESALLSIHRQIDDAQDAIASGVSTDLEGGAAQLSTQAADEFNSKYPNISKALGEVASIVVVDEARMVEDAP